MRLTKTFAKVGYRFKCKILRGEDTAFSGVIAFTMVEYDIGANGGRVKTKAHFGSAVVALQAAERYGRQRICQHRDLPQFLITKTELEEEGAHPCSPDIS